MSAIVDEAIIPFCTNAGLTYQVSTTGDMVTVAFAASPPAVGSLIFHIIADDDAGEAAVCVEIGRAPDERLAEVALAVAMHNAHYRFVTFALTSAGMVTADVCIELSYATNREALIGLGFERLALAVFATLPELQRAILGVPPKPTTAELGDRTMALLAEMPGGARHA